jgi:hypothetical protein
MEEFSIIKYLVEVAPVLGVLGWWVYSLKQDNKELRAYILETDKEKDKVLDNLAKVIEKLLDSVQVMPGNITNVLQTELRLLLSEIKALLSHKNDEA